MSLLLEPCPAPLPVPSPVYAGTLTLHWLPHDPAFCSCERLHKASARSQKEMVGFLRLFANTRRQWCYLRDTFHRGGPRLRFNVPSMLPRSMMPITMMPIISVWSTRPLDDDELRTHIRRARRETKGKRRCGAGEQTKSKQGAQGSHCLSLQQRRTQPEKDCIPNSTNGPTHNVCPIMIAPGLRGRHR
jgi:hypothetical protein